VPRLVGLVWLSCAVVAACGSTASERPRLTFSGSAVGAEGTLLRTQLARFSQRHPGIDVDIRITPDAADQRHQLYVQWLNARMVTPDVLQLDIVWTAEFAAAGWVQPLKEESVDANDFFPAAIAADRWRGVLYAVPWFVDVGLLYRRVDLFDRPPASLEALHGDALAAVQRGQAANGLVWQGARYEGLITVFLEYLTACGGRILDERGEVAVDSAAAVRALTLMRDGIGTFVPRSVVTSQEEQVRFSFQNGQSAFMRNWPYAWTLLQDERQSSVAGRVGVSFMPAASGGRPAAALGGGQLAINKFSRHPALALSLVEFLTDRDQMLERARVASQLPSRRSLYDGDELARAMSLPIGDLRAAIESAVARPVTPVYSEVSQLLQVHLHRALTRQEEPRDALTEAAREMRALFARTGLSGQDAP
jgi:ABC-type glycerol-3-phosphate transport system substrate-binding protein